MKNLIRFSVAMLACAVPALILPGCGGKPKKQTSPVAAETAADSENKSEFSSWKENAEVRAAIDAGQFARARQMLNDRLREDPKDARAHYLLGKTYVEEKSFARARKSLEAAIELAPDDRNFSRELGRCYAEMADENLSKDLPSEAAENFKKALEFDYQPRQTEEKLVSAYEMTAQQLISRKSMIDAENMLREAMNFLPDRPSLRVKLAGVLVEGDRLMEAERILKGLVETHPDFEHGLTAYARLLFRMGEVKAAAEFVGKALSLAPADPDALQLRAMLEKNVPIISPPAPEQMTPNSAREMIQQLDQARRVSEQKRILHNLLAQYPDENWAYLKLSEINEKLELYDESMTSIRKFLESEPDSEQGNFQHARLLQQKGRYEDALNLFNRLAPTYDDKETLLNEMGQVYARMGRFDEAREAWNSVLANNPEHPGCLFSQGQLLMELGNTAAAQEYFEKAVRAEPYNAKFRYFAGLNLIQSGLKDQAHSFWSASKSFLPEDDPYSIRINKATGSYQPASASSESSLPVVHVPSSVIEEAPEDPAYASALESARSGSFAQAIAGFREVLARDPANFNALMNLGKVFSVSGEPAQACALYLKALKLSPRNLFALKALANAYAEIGMHSFAAEITNQAQAANPGETEGFPVYKTSPAQVKNSPRAYQPLIRAFIDEKLTQEALAIVQSGTSQNQSAEMLLLQGEVYKELGQYETALDSYKKALELEPQSPTPYVKTGDLLIAAGQFTNAVGEYEKALKTSFIDPDTMFIIVERFRQLGRTADAQKVLGRLKGMNLNQSQLAKLDAYLGNSVSAKENN